MEKIKEILSHYSKFDVLEILTACENLIKGE